MAQALLLLSGAGAATYGRLAVHPVCTPLPQYENAAISSLSSLSRSALIPNKQLLSKAGNVLQFSRLSKGKSTRRPRVLAISELQEAALTAELQITESSPPATIPFPNGAESQLSNGASIAAQDSAQVLESSSLSTPSYLAKINALGTVQSVPEVDGPEPTAGSVLPSLDATVTEIPSPSASSPDLVDSAGTSASDVVKAAGEAVGPPEQMTPSQRYEALINDRNNSGNTNPVTGDGEAISFSIPDSLAAAQDSVTKTITDIQGAVKSSVDNAGQAVMDVYDNINGSIKGAINSVFGFYDKTLDNIQTSVDSTVSKAGGEVADFTSVFRTDTPLNNQLKEVVVVVKGATGTALEAAGKALTDVYGSARVLLPPEVQSSLGVAEHKVQEVSEPVGSFFQQAYAAFENVERALGVDPDNPVIPVILFVGGTLYLGVSFWQGRYGGYSGDLMPDSALDLLKKEDNVVLVDIRPQELREGEGIPDLRRGARSRFATVEAIKVDGSLRSKLKNVKEIDSLLTASVIRNLKTVKPSTKVIVMDTDGSQSKQIARALRRFGVRRRYRVEGGFKAWAASGMRTKLEGADTPISILKEDAEEIVEEVKPTPVGVVLVILGAVAGIYAAFEWEKTLQLLGVIGIGQAIYSRVKSYETVEDVKADLSLLQKPFKFVGDGILWIVGQVEPATLQLATSPSTSAVQDRVLQAAAKHGPLASELSEVAESDPDLDVETLAETTPSPPSPPSSPSPSPSPTPSPTPGESPVTLEAGPESPPPTVSE